MVLTICIIDQRLQTRINYINLLIEREITETELRTYLAGKYGVDISQISVTYTAMQDGVRKQITQPIQQDDRLSVVITCLTDTGTNCVIHDLGRAIKLGEKKDDKILLSSYDSIMKMNTGNNSYCLFEELQSLAKAGNKIVTLTIDDVRYHVEARVIDGYLLPPL